MHMETQLEHLAEHPTDEIKRLQRCINDLVSVLALPAIWSGGEPSQIVHTLLDALLSMLHLDLVYVRLKGPVGEAPIEMVRVAPTLKLALKLTTRPQEIGEVLNHWFGDDPQKWPPLVRNPIGDEDISIVPLRLGLQGEIGVIVAGSQRPDFPGQTERLLLSVAANQAAIGLQEARLLSEQKGVANELDQRVAQRTTELATANQELRKEIAERRLAEERLRQTERRLRTIIDTIPTIAWRTSPDGSGEYWNQRWHDYTGLSLEAVRGWGWQTVIHPEDLGEITATWLRFLAAGRPGEVEGRLRRFDGEYRWFLFRFCPLRDETGNIVNWYGTNTDIEDRKRAEALLAGEKRLLEMVAGGQSMSGTLEAICQLVESTASGCYCSVVLVDPSGTRLEYGAAPSLPASFITSIIGRPVSVDSGPCAMAAYLNEQVISADLTSETRWAAYEWCPMALAHGLKACWSTPITSTVGKVLGAFAIYYEEPRTPTSLHQNLIEQFTHIASIAVERAQNDAALKRSEAFLAEGQHLSRTGSFSWHVATDEITWSEQLYRIFEFDQSVPVTIELIGTRVHPEDLPLVYDMIDRARGACSDFEFEHRLLMPNHSVKYLHMVAHGTRDQNGRLEYIGAIQDVTQRRSAEEALGKARSELARVARVTSLGALTASIAHEVNQPLSGIITNASTCLRMLAADPPNVDGARETARRTIRDGNRASEVVTRLRALFSKKDATTESVDLNEATREVIALSLSKLQRNRVILRPELADDLPPVIADRVQLQQVILNLLLNASDAMSVVDDRPRQLVIRTERDEGDRVRLAVQDAGVGFEPQGVDKLFEPFYTTKSGGMGIGLSVSRSIIESHHGRLWAAPNDGPGATFSFSIPRGPEGMTGAPSLGTVRTPAATNAQHAMRSL
jgi:PAS domain S-box-containing protein